MKHLLLSILFLLTIIIVCKGEHTKIKRYQENKIGESKTIKGFFNSLE